MSKNHTLTTNKREQWTRFVLVALMVAMLLSFAISTGIMPVLADGEDAVGDLVGTVLGVITDAALYVGVVIVLWGAFQIIMALRREDSEAVGKQITTVVVGGTLVGFGAFADELLDALGVDITIE